MVSKESVKKGFEKTNKWLSLNPKVSIGAKLKQSKKLFIDITEIDIRKATLPSLFTPTPKSSIDKLQKWINKKQRGN